MKVYGTKLHYLLHPLDQMCNIEEHYESTRYFVQPNIIHRETVL